MSEKTSDLKTQVLLAAIECSDGDPTKTFTFEELLVRAWENNPQSWGLRGFEDKHPDSERIHRELDSRGKGSKGLVDSGDLERVKSRIYRLTSKGLADASRATPLKKGLREKVARRLEDDIVKILQHPCFKQWLADPSKPVRFREAGSFWGIAPGTPPSVIRQRIQRAEDVLETALAVLDRKELDGLGSGRGRLLFERTDVERGLEFQATLKRRFAPDLKVLGVGG